MTASTRLAQHPAIARSIAPAVVLVSAALAFGASAPLDPEPHHDGIQLAPAIAVSEGLWIQSEVFDQYGPITAWAQALSIEIMGPRLLSIRILTAIVLTGCALLLFLVARRISSSTWIGLGVTALWIILWPGRSVDSATHSLIPWPSTVFLLVQLGVALLLLRLIKDGCSRHQILGLLGALLGLAVLIRINTGLPLLVVALLALALLRLGGSRLTAAQWAWLGVGVSLPIIAVVLSMVANGALGDYLQQTIIGPLSGDATRGARTDPFYIKNAYLWGSAPLACVAAVVYFASRLRRLPIWGFTLILSLGVLSLVIWASSSIDGSPLRDLILSKLTWAPALDVQAAQPMYLAAIAAPIALIVVAVRLLKESRGLSPDRLSAAPMPLRLTVVLALLAVSSMAQLVPIADPYHLWWAAPLLLLLMIHMLTSGRSRRTRIAMLVLLVVPYALLAVPRTIDYLGQDRQVVEQGVLAGMQVPSSAFDDILAVDEVLGNVAPRSARFDCEDGLFAVWTGRYLSDSAAYLGWTFGVDAPPPIEPDTRLFVCVAPLPDGSPPDFEPPPGLEVVRSTGLINISYFNYMYLVELRAAPPVSS